MESSQFVGYKYDHDNSVLLITYHWISHVVPTFVMFCDLYLIPIVGYCRTISNSNSNSKMFYLTLIHYNFSSHIFNF